VDKYIGESARMIREMFAYAKDHQPCIIFMDEIDAIGKNKKKTKIFIFIII
jgi:26S proteasome regulatory subunit T4